MPKAHSQPQYIRFQAARLLDFVRKAQPKARVDWREPAEQGISCVVIGDHLDNACEAAITQDQGFQEYVVRLDAESAHLDFNLATLLALATEGCRSLLEDEPAAPDPANRFSGFDPLWKEP